MRMPRIPLLQRFSLRCMPFRHKINMGITLIVLLVAVLISIYVTRLATEALLDEGKRRGTALATNIALRAADSLLSSDLLRLSNIVNDLRGVDRDVVYGFILDDTGTVMAHTFGKTFPVELLKVNRLEPQQDAATLLLDTGQGHIYDFAAAVRIAGKPLGTVRVGLSRGKIVESVNDLALTITLVCGISLAIATLIGTQFAHRVTRRLNALREHAENIVCSELGMERSTFATRRHCWDTHRCDDRDCPAFGGPGKRCWVMLGTRCPRCSAALEAGTLPGECHGCLEASQPGDEIEELADAFNVLAGALHSRIEELRATERDLTRQQELLHTTLEATPDLVAMFDDEGRCLTVNRAYADFAGREPDELTGRHEKDILPEAVAGAFAADTVRVFATGQPSHLETSLQRHGKTHHFHVVKVPVFDETRRVSGVLSTARDITELRDYQGQLLQSQKMESIGKLAGGVAHEINTPLGIILGYAQLLQDDVPQGQLRDDLGIIEKQAKFCRKIVSDLLGFSRQTESQKKEMCFNNSIMEVVSLVRHTFSLENVEIITVLDDRLPIIYGAPDKLKQVWMNLLNNALGALPHGGIVKIRTRLDIAHMTVTAEFADTGTGVASENLRKIFDPFFSTKPVGKGTGLGLSVSFGIIEDHQGSLEAVSPLPEGTITEPLPAGVLAAAPQGEVPGPGTLLRVTLPLEPINPPPPPQEG